MMTAVMRHMFRGCVKYIVIYGGHTSGFGSETNSSAWYDGWYIKFVRLTFGLPMAQYVPPFLKLPGMT